MRRNTADYGRKGGISKADSERECKKYEKRGKVREKKKSRDGGH